MPIQATEGQLRPIDRHTVYQCCLGQPGQRVYEVIRWIDATLREMGIMTGVFAADVTVSPAVRPVEALPRHDDYILVLHHSTIGTATQMASEIEAVEACSAPIVVLHHSRPRQSPTLSLKRWVPWAVSALGCDLLATIELRSAGFASPCVLPWLPDQVMQRRTKSHAFTIVAPGDMTGASPALIIIDAFARFHEQRKSPSRLVLLGRTLDAPMAKSIQDQVRRHDLVEAVVITGATDPPALSGYIANADVCLVLSDAASAIDAWSEATRTGVPVLANPVVALASALGPCGLQDVPPDQLPSSEVVAAAMLDMVDPARAQALALAQRNHARGNRTASPEVVLMAALGRCGLMLPSERLARQVVAQQAGFVVGGDFFAAGWQSTLATRLASALERRRPGSVTVVPGFPSPPGVLGRRPLENDPLLDVLLQRPRPISAPTVLLCPPSDLGASAAPNDLSLGVIAEEPVTVEVTRRLNDEVAGVLVTSNTAARALNAFGLRVPTRVVGHGIDVEAGLRHGHERLSKARLKQDSVKLASEQFVMVHRSSCSRQAGIDVLIAAWARAFARTDLVRLVILHPEARHGAIHDQLDAVDAGNIAEIELVADEAPYRSAREVLEHSHWSVLPARTEDCSPSAVEAMAAGVPLIITGHGAHRDFLDADNARLIDYRFLLPQQDALRMPYAEPSLDDLVLAFQEAFEDHRVGGRRAHCYARAALRVSVDRFEVRPWADQIALAAGELLMDPPSPLRRVAWMSPWGVRCGIAEYSKALLGHRPAACQGCPPKILLLCDRRTEAATNLPDLDGVEVCPAWDAGSLEIARDITLRLTHFEPQVMIVQHQDALIGWEALIQLVDLTGTLRIRLLVALHSTASIGRLNHKLQASVLFSLALVEQVIVHSIHDVENLRVWGLVDNVVLLPHGAPSPSVSPERSSSPARKVAGPRIGCYGFFLPNKGIATLIEAFALLRDDWPDATLRLVNARYPGAESEREIQRCRALAKRLMVSDAIEWNTSYFSDAASLSLLAQCDLIVMPHGDSAESASGAVRLALASGKPVAASLARIFDDIAGVAHRVDAGKAINLAADIQHLLVNEALRLSVLVPAFDFLRAHDWRVISRRLFDMADGLSRRPKSSERGPLVRYGVDSPLLFNQIGERTSKSLVFLGDRGVGLYGPYVRLPAGEYIASYEFDRCSTVTGTAHFHVYAAFGTLTLAALAKTYDQTETPERGVNLPFSLTTAIADVELGVFCEAGFFARLLGVSIRRVSVY